MIFCQKWSDMAEREWGEFVQNNTSFSGFSFFFGGGGDDAKLVHVTHPLSVTSARDWSNSTLGLPAKLIY